MVNEINSRSEEVNAQLIMANRAYYGLQNHMKSRNISRNIKTLLYKTLIRPVLTYGSETWVLSKQDEYCLSIFEQKILQRIYGPVNDGGRWQIRTNQELYCLVRMTMWNSANWADWDGHDMSYARMMMIYPGQSCSVSQEESAPEGDPGCAGKVEWRKMQQSYGVETGQ